MTRLTRAQAAKLGAGDEYDSDLEAEFAFHLRALGVPAPETHYEFHAGSGKSFDFAWPAQCVAVEVNGEAVHGHWRKQREDAEKIIMAQLDGWFIVVLTGQMIRNNPEWCVEQVQRALWRCRAGEG